MGLSGSLRVYVALTALSLVIWQPLASGQSSAALKSPGTRNDQRLVTLAEEVRHQLVTLPYYTVFDWLEARFPAGTR